MNHSEINPLRRTVAAKDVLPFIVAAVVDMEALLGTTLDPDDRQELEVELAAARHLRDEALADPDRPMTLEIYPASTEQPNSPLFGLFGLAGPLN